MQKHLQKNISAYVIVNLFIVDVYINIITNKKHGLCIKHKAEIASSIFCCFHIFIRTEIAVSNKRMKNALHIFSQQVLEMQSSK